MSEHLPSNPRDRLAPLRKQFPTYSERELNEAYRNLRSYFKIGWKIALRLKKEGRLKAVFDSIQSSSYDDGKVEPTPIINSPTKHN